MSEPTAPAKRWRRWLLEALVVIAILVAVRAWQTRDLPSGPAPALDARDLAGTPVSLEDLERPVIVHFMASWCGVCRAEEPNVAAVARDHDVIAIATTSGSPDEVRAWIESETELDATRIVADPRGTLAQRWGVRAFPTSFYVDREGDIRHVEVGYTTELGMRARVWLAGL
ncbi:redoxin domain-containing protein [Sandaracinus amylolyticus]|uniref:Secreted protein, suppressor for copper-sensitivity D n=1 Tax=Sandaracinus amylolyticus TaxID=927083 RepID=A0A0F6W3I9_9BACT|nr:redoxin domain-containing protein [Sandaracinus amylolyticus]AKF06568.1 Secreted protein, suppressor for copper-sensitivity D [Sandaracinus amylolyticus]